MIKKYFVCTKGDDRELLMVTMDKGLAERCLDDGSCDKIITIGTVRGYDEIAEMFSMEDCRTDRDLSYKIMYGKQFKTIYGEIR